MRRVKPGDQLVIKHTVASIPLNYVAGSLRRKLRPRHGGAVFDPLVVVNNLGIAVPIPGSSRDLCIVV